MQEATCGYYVGIPTAKNTLKMTEQMQQEQDIGLGGKTKPYLVVYHPVSSDAFGIVQMVQRRNLQEKVRNRKTQQFPEFR